MAAARAFGRLEALAQAMKTKLKSSVLEILLGLAVLSGWASMGSGVGHANATSGSASIYPRASQSRSVPLGKEPLRKELVRRQEQTGLSLVTLGDLSILAVDFKRRGLMKAAAAPGIGVFSDDGTNIAFTSLRSSLGGISHFDGSDFQEYPDFSPRDLCWSPDGTKLSMLLSSGNRSGLYIWSIKSRSMLRISEDGSLTSQCWSPDGKQIIYKDGMMKIYDLEQNRSRELGPGELPTWSPDGQWIAYLDRDTYYAIRPDGQEKKTLFRKKYPQSALWWSPDSRLIAYLAVANPFVGGLTLDVENFRLHVRRLSDNSDVWVANSMGGSTYQWVTNPILLSLAESKSTQK